MSQNLATLICNFIESTAIGHERAIYRLFSIKAVPLQVLQESTFDSLHLKQSIGYFNNAYRSLILRDDPYIAAHFDAMHKVSGHSYICLLNIVFATYLATHRAVDRSSLNLSSLEALTESLKTRLQPLLVALKNDLEKSFSHQCHGIDIKTCNPNEPMFYAKLANEK